MAVLSILLLMALCQESTLGFTSGIYKSSIIKKRTSSISAWKHTRSSSLSMMASDARPKKVIVLGGDGFCGWPTSVYLSEQVCFKSIASIVDVVK